MASRGKPPPPDWDIVVECFREAEFLWGRWEHALDSHRHTLDDVDHWVEERLLGAIDGTVVGGARAIDALLVPALAATRPREASAAAFALACAGPPGFEPLMRALAELPAEKLDAVARGMELTRDSGDPMRWWSRVPRLPPAGQAAMLRIYAFRQLPAPPETDRIIDRSALEVQLACLQLAATTRAAWAHPYIEWGLQRSSPALRAAAAWAGMILGVKNAKAVAAELARTGSDDADALLVPLAAAEGERVLPFVQARLQRGARSRAVFEALVAVGTVEAGDVCSSALLQEPCARLAADALCAIAGIPADAPELRPTLDPDRLPAHADTALPEPDTDALVQRWIRTRTSFSARKRHLGGRPFGFDALGNALERVPTRRRHLLATELALRTGGLARVSTTAWTAVQRAQLATISVPLPSPPSRRLPSHLV